MTRNSRNNDDSNNEDRARTEGEDGEDEGVKMKKPATVDSNGYDGHLGGS